MSLFSFREVSFWYPGGSYIFKSLSADLTAGGFYLLKGPSGSGKSTLLRLMNRLEEPCSGRLFFKGQDIRNPDAAQLRRSILYIQQTPVVIKGCVRDNLVLPFGFKANREMAPPSDDELKEMLGHFSLEEVNLDANAEELSVGQQQRICFIRGLLLNPEIILLDEPTSALDENSARIVEQKVQQLAAQSGVTVVMVSHKVFPADIVVPEYLNLDNGTGILQA